MTPAGTSNELDVQNEWEEKTHTHTANYIFNITRLKVSWSAVKVVFLKKIELGFPHVKKGKRGACQQKAATVLPNRTAAT